MKTILAILALALAVAAAPAQSPPAAAPAADDAIRAALEKAYAQAGAEPPAPAPRTTPSRIRRTGTGTNTAAPANPPTTLPTTLPASDATKPAAVAPTNPGAATAPRLATSAPPLLATSAPPAHATSAPPATAASVPAVTNKETGPSITNPPAPAAEPATPVASQAATPAPPSPAPAGVAAPTAASAPKTSAVPASASSPTNRGVVNVFAADRTNRQQRTVPGLSIPPAPGPRAPGAATTGTAPGVPGQPATVTPAGAGQAAVPGAADAAAGKEEEVFPPGLIKFSDADIGQVLEIYQELTGRTVLKPNSLPAVKVTIRSQTQLTRSEAIHALDSILSLNGVAMVPQGEKFVKALAEAQGGQAAQRFNELPHDLLPEAGSLVTHVVQLKNAIPTEIQPALQAFAKLPNSILAINSTSMLVLRDYAENVKRMLEILEQIDIVPPQDFVDVVIPIRYALAGDIAQVLSSLTAGGGGATTVGRAATRSGLSSGGGLGGGLGGAGSIPGQPGYNPAQALQQQQGAAGGIGGAAAQRSSFADRLRSIVNRAGPGGTGDIFVLGQTKIIADERTNSLLIFASKQDLGTISNIIDKLDVVLAQVIIEGIFMEVALGDDLDYAVSLVQKTPSTSGQTLGIGASKNHNQTLNIGNFLGSGSNALSSGLSYFANINDDLEATFTAIANDRNVNVLARPRIQTSHAEEANLFVGETRPYITGTYNSFQGVGGSSTYSQLQIGLTLSVLPLINADGLVVMDIRQKIQQIGEEVIIDGNPIPATIDREANAKVSVRDREVILLGGMISAESRKSKSGVPILKDIPGFGAFFRAASKEQQRRELVVLIRPTVLPTPQEAAIVASEERALLPGIAEWERDVRKDERKRVEDYNKRLYKREGFKK